MSRKAGSFELGDRWRSGLDDFRMDDLVITRHAMQRVEERGGTLEDLRRAPGARGAGGAVLKGHTVVTYLPRARLPVAVSGVMGAGNGRVLPKELFSTAPSGAAPADSASVNVAGCEGHVVGAKGHTLIAMSRKYGVHISVGPNGRALVWGGSSDEVGSAVAAIEGIVKGARRRNRRSIPGAINVVDVTKGHNSATSAPADSAAAFPSASPPSAVQSPPPQTQPQLQPAPWQEAANSAICGECGDQVTDVRLRCGFCDSVFYCHALHARAHWPVHSAVCKAEPPMPANLALQPAAQQSTLARF